MTEWVSLLSAAGAGIAASLVSTWITNKLKRKKDVVYDVALSSGRHREVKVSKSRANDVDSSVQEALFGALNLMHRDEIDPKSRELLKRFVAELERQRSISPLSRQLVLVLGRAYRNLGEGQKAIEVLSEYIAKKERAQQPDSDVGDAYYNLACYFALDGQNFLAVENLKRAISLHPDNIEAAKVDPDLSSIRQDLKEVLSANPVS